ncbi:outer membrane protein assembly factor BamB family protein [Micromonosporaceae bacterium Da 78-11]
MSVESGAVVIIELGLERGEPETYASPRRSTVPTWLPPALLALVVLLCSAASAAPARSPLSTVFHLPAGPTDAYALTEGGELLAQTFGLLTSYRLGDGQMRWQAGQSSPAYRLRMSAGIVLMRPWTVGPEDPGTTAVSIDTGAALWRRPGNVVTVAGSSTLLAATIVRSSGNSGRRVQGQVDAVDPVTGLSRWTVPIPSTAVLLGVPGPADEGARMLLVHDDRTAAVHDLVTGRLLASTKLPATDYDPDNPAVAGGLLLLSHPGAQGTEISAYDPVTLKPLWTEPADGVYSIRACGRLACLTGAHGVRAVDPLTGDRRWSRPDWQAIEQRGPMSIVFASPDGTAPLGLIDPDSGRMLVDLAGWRLVGGSGGDHLLVTRAVGAGARTMVAVARPGDPRPSLLAELPAGTGDCQTVPSRLVCRSTYGELVVWAYRWKG